MAQKVQMKDKTAKSASQRFYERHGFNDSTDKESIMKVWSFRLHEDEWLEARLRAKTQHQKFIDWARSKIMKIGDYKKFLEKNE